MKQIRVTTKKDRFGFDGQTGVLVLAGTGGTIEALTIVKAGVSGRNGREIHAPKLTVFWDYALVQDKTNKDDPTTTEHWEESEIDPAEVQHAGAIDSETPPK
jgi:hypothetical protein